MRFFNKQYGVTLLEVMLVLAIASGIIYLSFRQYLSYRRDANVLIVQRNVDLLFQALTNYFRANCRTNSVLTQSYPPQAYGITMDDLRNQGYLTADFPENPIVDNSGPSEGYVLQFNQYQGPTGIPKREQEMSTAAGGGTVPIGSIIIWKAQVAVALKLPAQATIYKNLLAADCLSNFASGWNIVVPCSFNPTTGNYAVFERGPSYSMSQSNSTYWVSRPTQKQFIQMYTTDPILLLISTPAHTSSQYFVCGSS